MDVTLVDRIQKLGQLYPNNPLIVKAHNGSQAATLLAYYSQSNLQTVTFSQSPEKSAPKITFEKEKLEDRVGIIMDENYSKKVAVNDWGRMKYLLFSEKTGLFAFKDKPVRLQFSERKHGAIRIAKPVGYFQGAEEAEQVVPERKRYIAYLGLIPENEISLKKGMSNIRSRRKFRKNVTLDAMFQYYFELPLTIELIEGSKDIREINV